MRRNQPNQHVNATLLAADGSVVDSGTTTVYVTGDNGSRAAGNGTVTNKTGGDWDYGPTAAETNFTHIKFTFENPGAVPVGINVYTNNSADQTGDAYDVANTRLPVTLISGRMSSDLQGMDGRPNSAQNLAAGADQIVRFSVGPGATATSIPTDIVNPLYTGPDHFRGRVVTIDGETRKVYASGGSPVVLTTEEFQSIPPQNNPGVIS